jgi:UDP-galactopyranose mutase
MYPINNDICNAAYAKYKALFDGVDRFYYLGRLADYKYYNMEATILRALDFAELLKEDPIENRS